MKWANEYSIGIEEIDSQHKELLALFSAVEDQVKVLEDGVLKPWKNA